MRYLVKLNEDSGELDEFAHKHSLREVTIFKFLNMLAFDYDRNVDSFDLDLLGEEPEVKYIQEDVEIRLGQLQEIHEELAPRLEGAFVNVRTASSTLGPNFGTFQEYYGYLEMLNSVDYDSTSSIHDYSTTSSGQGVDVYMVDSGVNFSHPSLQGRVLRCPTFNLNLGDAEDQDDETNGGHGTYGSLYMGGADGGVAPDTRIYALKVFDTDGSGSMFNIAAACNAVVEHHNTKNDGRPSILNASLGGVVSGTSRYVTVDATGDDNTLLDAVKTTAASGVHVVMSAGNGFLEGGDPDVFYGPNLSTLQSGRIHLSPEETGNNDPGQGLPIIVGATRNRTSHPGIPTSAPAYTGHMASFSNYGRGNTVSAPGQWLPSSRWDSTYIGQGTTWTWKSGTSFSGPITAGLLALHLEKNPTQTPYEAKQALMGFCIPDTTINMMHKLEFAPGECSITHSVEDQLLTLSFTPALSSSQLSHFRKIVNKTPTQHGVEWGNLQSGDFIQISVPDITNHPHADWHEFASLDSNELVLRTNLSVESSQFNLQNEKLWISVVAGTHEETDGVKIWQEKTASGFDWSSLSTANRLIRYPGLAEVHIRDTEYTEDLVAFNPYQNYQIEWAIGDEIVLEYTGSSTTSNAPSVNADIRTLLRNEQPYPTTFELINGTLPNGWYMSNSGVFSTSTLEGPGNYTDTITLRASNGFQVFDKQFSVTTIGGQPAPDPLNDYTLKHIHNIVFYGGCGDDVTGMCEEWALGSSASADIDMVYQLNGSGNVVESWSSRIPSFVSQPISSLKCGQMYYIRLKKFDNVTPLNEIEIPGIRVIYAPRNHDLISISDTDGCDQVDRATTPNWLWMKCHMIWYGRCNTESIQAVAPHELVATEFEEVWRTNDSGGLEKWSASDTENSAFTHLEPGMGYLVKLADNHIHASESNYTLTIDGVTSHSPWVDYYLPSSRARYCPSSPSADFTNFIRDYQGLTEGEREDAGDIIGEITYVDLEGGFYGVVTSAGESYLPINIQDELTGHAGKTIYITDSYSKKDAVSIFMWGTLVFCLDWEIDGVSIPPGVCTEDARICPDDSVVVRDPARDCNFAPCSFDKDGFETNKQIWENSVTTNYKFDFNWSCFCTPEYTQSVTIFVWNNEIDKIVEIDSGDELPSSNDSIYYTLGGLFDYIQSEYDQHPYQLEVEYDTERGYMKSASIDRAVDMADDEMAFSVSNFDIMVSIG